ncbi:DUF998 domain-containing protein [Ignisphaera sp. 4213-co]|uniref:DUF998 domain-containing protein n=1 Tax=Ignisphaera cupida TaxID=3050454 RepID=A0ABD4Z6Z8_9CREN|nr:DUF998 domain-containing protein [Ignisphaera sp. 4213-co]MDK6028650.1 DUF998 domain-containing protein [Ignisphaera sp. 4213-co]
MVNDMINTIIFTIWKFTGIIAAVLAWIIIAISISQNPWFDVFKHALSDLGGSKANNPWIYNIGLIVTGVITCLYALYIAYVANSKVYVYASALLFVAGIFLALIGIYPSGTRPHTFVSTWFFIQMLLAIIATAIGMAVEHRIVYSIVFGVVAIAGPLGAIFLKWPSVALLEIYGIVLIDICVVLMTTRF